MPTLSGLTNMSNVTGFASLGDYANSVTDGYFGISLALMFFLVSWLGMSNYSKVQALPMASFGTLIFTVFLVLIGWLHIMFVGAPLVVLLFSFFLMPGAKD